MSGRNFRGEKLNEFDDTPVVFSGRKMANHHFEREYLHSAKCPFTVWPEWKPRPTRVNSRTGFIGHSRYPRDIPRDLSFSPHRRT